MSSRAVAKAAAKPADAALTKAMEASMATMPDPATRPLLDSATVFVRDLQSTLANAEGEIELLNAIDAREDDALRDALGRLQVMHDGKRAGRDRLRAEYAEIAQRCKAALGLGVEEQGQ